MKELALKLNAQINHKKSMHTLAILSAIVAIVILRVPLMNGIGYIFHSLFVLCWNLAGWLDKIIWGVKVQ